LYLVWADKQEMNRVFQNILKNSVQSFEGNGVIEVRSFNSPTKVIVEIKDNGCGIDPEILGKLFEPNFSTKSTGMGLGLAITKKSLDDMKARISFNSKLGEGTTVIMNFIRYEE
jgi:two-component system nitrogen regulation sensor histidine kinase NtrY